MATSDERSASAPPSLALPPPLSPQPPTNTPTAASGQNMMLLCAEMLSPNLNFPIFISRTVLDGLARRHACVLMHLKPIILAAYQAYNAARSVPDTACIACVSAVWSSPSPYLWPRTTQLLPDRNKDNVELIKHVANDSPASYLRFQYFAWVNQSYPLPSANRVLVLVPLQPTPDYRHQGQWPAQPIQQPQTDLVQPQNQVDDSHGQQGRSAWERLHAQTLA